MAPAPAEYAAFTRRRALWQALGLRPEEMTAPDYFRALLFLRLEAEAEARRSEAART